jgi:hypothetical protein
VQLDRLFGHEGELQASRAHRSEVIAQNHTIACTCNWAN